MVVSPKRLNQLKKAAEKKMKKSSLQQPQHLPFLIFPLLGCLDNNT